MLTLLLAGSHTPSWLWLLGVGCDILGWIFLIGANTLFNSDKRIVKWLTTIPVSMWLILCGASMWMLLKSN